MTLHVERLSWTPGGAFVLREVGFETPPGTVTAVVGVNGSGKSALLRLLAGLHRPSSGTVLWHGRTVPRRGRRRSFGYLGQDVGPAPDREPVASPRRRRALLLDGVLTPGPGVHLLDEPFEGLSDDALPAVLERLRDCVDAGSAVVLATQRLDVVADVADDLVVLSQGRVAARSRLALPHQAPVLVDLELDGPGADTAWLRGRPGIQLIDAGARWAVFAAQDVAAGQEVLREAARRGRVRRFGEPPAGLRRRVPENVLRLRPPR